MRQLAAGLVLFLLAAIGRAATTPPTDSGQQLSQTETTQQLQQQQQPAPAQEKKPLIVITGAHLPPPAVEPKTKKEQEKEAARQKAAHAGLDESIILTIDGLPAYLDYAAAHDKQVSLFINGNDTGIAPEAIDRKEGTLQFLLDRNGDNKDVWEPLLRYPFAHKTRQVKASVGLKGESNADSSATFTLVVVAWVWYAGFWLGIILIFLAAFFWLAIKHSLLRDGPPIDANTPRPWSLGRCQMAWWFFLIVIAYIVIWLISGDQDTISGSLLGLMGISSGTALGATLIEANSNAAPRKSSGHFLTDILSEADNQIALHRFQIVVWTIVLGIMFVVSVSNDLTMPEFSGTLLTMMGISSGTYLGFKLEK
jgi:hypothetical protein